MTLLAIVYLAGVAWGIAAGDARPVARVALAVLWPLGPLAFVVTIAILVGAIPVALIARR